MRNSFFEVDRSLEMATQSLWSLLLWDIQNLPGQNHMQPALGELALAGGLDQMISSGPFLPQTLCEC